MQLDAGFSLVNCQGIVALAAFAARFVRGQEDAQGGDIGHPLGEALARQDTQLEFRPR